MFLSLNYVVVCIGKKARPSAEDHTIGHATDISCRDRPWKVHDLFFLLQLCNVLTDYNWTSTAFPEL